MGRLDNRIRTICPICGRREKVVINLIRNIFKCKNCGYNNMNRHDYSEIKEVYDLE